MAVSSQLVLFEHKNKACSMSYFYHHSQIYVILTPYDICYRPKVTLAWGHFFDEELQYWCEDLDTSFKDVTFSRGEIFGRMRSKVL